MNFLLFERQTVPYNVLAAWVRSFEDRYSIGGGYRALVLAPSWAQHTLYGNNLPEAVEAFANLLSENNVPFERRAMDELPVELQQLVGDAVSGW